MLGYVNYASGGTLAELDLGDTRTAMAMARLRQDCISAKEALSVDTETVVPVFFPGRPFEVELTRGLFEEMIRAPVESTIGALRRTLRSAQVDPAELSAVLLVGGSSRIPLVAEMISRELGRPTLVDTHPKYAIALGAALLADAPTGARAATVAAHTVSTAAPARSPAPQQPTTGPAGPGSTTPGLRRGLEWAPKDALVEPTPPTVQTTPTDDPATGPLEFSPPTGAEKLGTDPAASRSPHRGADERRLAEPAADTVRTSDTPPGSLPPASAGSPAPRPAHRRRPSLLVGAGVVVLALIAAVAWLGWRSSTGENGGSGAAQASAATAPPPSQIAASVPVPTLGAAIPAGQTPGFAAVSPNGRLVYVANRDAGVVTVIDTSINQATATIPVNAGPPQYLVFAPDGRHVYISVFDDARTVHAVAVLDTTTNDIVATIPVRSRPFLGAVTTDGHRLWVPNHDSGTISVIDTDTNAVVREIAVAPNPHWVAFSRDGTRAYTANHESNLVAVIDTASYRVLAQVPVDTSPHSVAVHPSRPLVANVNYDADTVTMIDTNTNTVVARVPVGHNPQNVTWSPDGRFAYVANNSGNSISVIDAQTLRVTATLPTPPGPTSVAVTPDGHTGYVSCTDGGVLAVLNLIG